MRFFHWGRILVALSMLAMTSNLVHALTHDAWPSKPIRLIVPFALGSFTHTAARSVGAELTSLLGQPVLVEARAGAGSFLGTDVVAKAAPDGYTFLVTDNSFAVTAILHDRPSYSLKDFTQVSLIADAPAVLVARPTLAASTLSEVVELARKEPGQLTFGSGGTGSSAHLAMEAFLLKYKLEMTHVPFKGVAAAIFDVSAGRVDLAISSIGSTAGYIKDSRIRALAVTGAKRLDVFPDIPTFAEAGFPNYDMMYWFGLMAPAGTPAEIVNRMQKAIAKAIDSEKVKEVFVGSGVRPIATTPEAFAQIVQNETNLWSEVIHRGKIKAE